MAKSTIIFGNGLGMALDENIFSLANALDKVWDDEGILNDAARKAICACLPHSNCNGRPSCEDDLEKLQQVLHACDFLTSIRLEGRNHWLSDEGQEFPRAIRTFIRKVSGTFVNTGMELPADFIDPLSEYISETRSYIATLNYDDLLYEALIRKEILRGFNGALVDGITGNGFESKNLERKFGKDFGWYLHLHGSPLFYNDESGTIKKLTRRDFNRDPAVNSTHIVLTHVKYKPAIIAASEILATYWKKLKDALDDSTYIVLFGYSGCDPHLNEIINRNCGKKSISVIEWSGSGSHEARHKIWHDHFGKRVEVIHLDDILEFTEW